VRGCVAGLVVGILLTLVGCAGDASPGAAPTTASTEPTRATDSAESTLATLRSAFEKQTTSVLTFEAVGQAQSLYGKAELLRGPDVATRITLSSEKDSALYLTFVLSDGAPYVTRSDIGPGLDKPWARLEVADRSDLSRAMLERVLSILETTDFAGALDLGSASTITDEGPVSIGGVAATRYRVVTDVSEAIAATDGITQRGLKMLDARGVETIRSTWWIDESDLPVRFEQRTNTGTVTVRFESWGRDLDIAPPPPDEVGDLQTLFADEASRP
jgi:hypothetical protein